MSNNHSGKDHYKLYKAGKLWLTALVTTTVFGVALLGTQDASANTNPAVATDVKADFKTDMNNRYIDVSGAAGSIINDNEAASASEGAPAKADQSAKNDISTTLDNDQALRQKFTGISDGQLSQHPLGKASIFHIFSNEVKIGADVNGNIATKKLVNGPEFGTRSDSHNFTSGDVYYIEHIDAIGANAFRTGNNYVVLGDDSNVEVKGNQVYVNGNRLDHLNASDYHLVKDYINFEEEFNQLRQRATELANRESATDVKADFKTDMNNRYIDVSGAAGSIIVVDVPVEYLEAPQPITIKGLSSDDAGPLVVLNVKSDKNTVNFNTQVKLNYNDGNTVSPSEGHSEPNHVLWNFSNTVNEVNVNSGYLLGSVLAPNATFNAGVNVDGNIVANVVNINGGESHRWDLHAPNYFAEVGPKDDGDRGGQKDSSTDNEKNPVPVTPHADDDEEEVVDHGGTNKDEQPSSPSDTPAPSNKPSDKPTQPTTPTSSNAANKDKEADQPGSEAPASSEQAQPVAPSDTPNKAGSDTSEPAQPDTPGKDRQPNHPYFPHWDYPVIPDHKGASAGSSSETPAGSESPKAETPVVPINPTSPVVPELPESTNPGTPELPASDTPAESAVPSAPATPETPVVPVTPATSDTPKSLTVVDDTTEEENAASFNDGRVTTSPNTVTTPVTGNKTIVNNSKNSGEIISVVTTNQAETESNQTGLPQTGNEQESKLGILGFTCAFVLALMGFSKKKAK
ncbi:collagen-binding domain-containing protein [Limosilactobacillus viscerum]|uniref:collagen-binding domain-containing protein n=1 Tax=Limosilactobacillus viscerum TaxID=2993450 RepID=UPI0024B91578|nr:collagen-binding domain-containing protein [Limosilactobacillus viscerum]